MTPFTLRNWQAEALEEIEAATLTDPPERAKRGVVRAIMGAGKSVVIGETAARAVANGWRVVITTPTVNLVDQLTSTVGRFVGGVNVGRYYTYAKEVGRPVTVCCHPSVLPYQEAAGVSPDLWIADECHKTECDKMIEFAERYQPARRLGFTATPYRADAAEAISLFDDLIYDYGVKQAQQDGVIVPLRVVPWQGPKVLAYDAGVELSKGAVGPGMWSSRRIAEADFLAHCLTADGRNAVSIHSQLSRRQTAEALEGLESGAYSEAVHVSMLAEGVDMPWLRWLVAYRPVGSRVRFAQEVGRILRTAPGKTEAILFDPLGLWDRHDLSYGALLGEVEPLEELGLLRQVVDAANQGPAELETLFAVSKGSYRRALDQLNLDLDGSGALPQKRDVFTRGPWRDDRASRGQLAALENLAWVFDRLPRLGYKGEALRALYVARDVTTLTKGEASDLITMGLALKYANNWPEEV